jgi:hypothetical protein
VGSSMIVQRGFWRYPWKKWKREPILKALAY